MNLSGGHWINEYGYHRHDTGRRKNGRAVFEFTLDEDAPMTFQVSEKYFVQPDRHGFSNGGNVPWIVQWIIPEDLHNPSWILHDIACADPLHRLYFSSSLNGQYVQRRVTSEEAARIMGIGLHAAGHTRRAHVAYRFVKWFGPKWTAQARSLDGALDTSEG